MGGFFFLLINGLLVLVVTVASWLRPQVSSLSPLEHGKRIVQTHNSEGAPLSSRPDKWLQWIKNLRMKEGKQMTHNRMTVALGLGRSNIQY